MLSACKGLCCSSTGKLLASEPTSLVELANLPAVGCRSWFAVWQAALAALASVYHNLYVSDWQEVRFVFELEVVGAQGGERRDTSALC